MTGGAAVQAAVEAVTVAAGDVFPAASYARTAKTYEVAHASPDAANVVVLVLLAAPPSIDTVYPLTARSSLEADHVSVPPVCVTPANES